MINLLCDSIAFKPLLTGHEFTVTASSLRKKKKKIPLENTVAYLHLAQQSQRESCHQMFPDLKVRQNTLNALLKTDDREIIIML